MHPAAIVLHDQVARGKTPGLQYLHFTPDSILFRYHGGVADVASRVPVGPHTTFNGFSVTKIVTAVAVLQLVESGEMAMDASAADYLPAFPYSDTITVRNLLTHTAGIPNPLPLRWTHLASEHASFDRNAFFSRVYAKHRSSANANAQVVYSNLGYQLLGEMIETVTGVTYEDYVREHILAPIGIAPRQLGFAPDPAVHAAGYHQCLRVSYPVMRLLLYRKAVFAGREEGWHRFRPYHMNGAAYGGLAGSADGFARFLQVLLDPDNGILSRGSKERLFAEHKLDGGRPSGMAQGWFTGTLNGHRYLHHAGGGGGYYAELRLYPALRRGSVLLFNRTGLANARFLDRVDRYHIQSSRR
jgi:CubicO group peptidase (beta-lactamase class C family)